MDKWSTNKTVSSLENPKGFKVIQIPALLARAVLLETSGGCELCGRITESDDIMYYIASINQVYCDTCFIAWYNSATRYKPDIEQEEKNYERVVQILKGAGWWETPLK